MIWFSGGQIGRTIGQLVNRRYAVLEPGKSYKIAHIVDQKYIVLEGFEDEPGGGINWEEVFSTT